MHHKTNISSTILTYDEDDGQILEYCVNRDAQELLSSPSLNSHQIV